MGKEAVGHVGAGVVVALAVLVPLITEWVPSGRVGDGVSVFSSE